MRPEKGVAQGLQYCAHILQAKEAVRMRNWTGCVAFCIVLSVFHIARSGAEEFVTKADFDKFVAQFEQFKVQNEVLTRENIQLRVEVKAIREREAGAPIVSPVDKALSAERYNQIHNQIAALKSDTKFLLTGGGSTTYVDSKSDPS